MNSAVGEPPAPRVMARLGHYLAGRPASRGRRTSLPPRQQIVEQPHRRFRRPLLLLYERPRRRPHPRPFRRVAEQACDHGVQLRRILHLPRRPDARSADEPAP